MIPHAHDTFSGEIPDENALDSRMIEDDHLRAVFFRQRARRVM
jgi:hypothetical protein